jgi:hypothetical protein
MKYIMIVVAMLLGACNHSEQQVQTVQYPEAGSEALNNFQSQCSQCHQPPRPSAHTASEWPSVIARMQQHRIERRIAPMMGYKMVAVRDYLVRNAAPVAAQ